MSSSVQTVWRESWGSLVAVCLQLAVVAGSPTSCVSASAPHLSKGCQAQVWGVAMHARVLVMHARVFALDDMPEA